MKNQVPIKKSELTRLYELALRGLQRSDGMVADLGIMHDSAFFVHQRSAFAWAYTAIYESPGDENAYVNFPSTMLVELVVSARAAVDAVNVVKMAAGEDPIAVPELITNWAAQLSFPEVFTPYAVIPVAEMKQILLESQGRQGIMPRVGLSLDGLHPTVRKWMQLIGFEDVVVPEAMKALVQ